MDHYYSLQSNHYKNILFSLFSFYFHPIPILFAFLLLFLLTHFLFIISLYFTIIYLLFYYLFSIFTISISQILFNIYLYLSNFIVLVLFIPSHRSPFLITFISAIFQIKEDLGFDPIDLKKTIIDMAYSMIEQGFVKKTPKYLGPPETRSEVPK